MNFRDSPEQTLIRDSVRRFTASAHPFYGEARPAPSQWDIVARNGWPAIALSEDSGGLGFSLVDICILFEEFGRGRAIEPYLSCVLLAAGLIDRLGNAEQREALLPGVVEGQTLLAFAHEERGQENAQGTRAERHPVGWVLNGRKTGVTGAPDADMLVVSARTPQGVSAFLVPADTAGISLSPYDTVDGFAAADIEFDNVRLDQGALLGREDDAANAIDLVTAHAILATCAESVGSMERVLQVTRDYVRMRRQFGHALATFQAVQHRLADMFVETEMSRSAIYAALSDVANGGSVSRAAAGAMSTVARSARFVCESGIQLHGGMGMTEAVEIGHHYRRVLAREAQFGHADSHLQRYARLGKVQDT